MLSKRERCVARGPGAAGSGHRPGMETLGGLLMRELPCGVGPRARSPACRALVRVVAATRGFAMSKAAMTAIRAVALPPRHRRPENHTAPVSAATTRPRPTRTLARSSSEHPPSRRPLSKGLSQRLRSSGSLILDIGDYPEQGERQQHEEEEVSPIRCASTVEEDHSHDCRQPNDNHDARSQWRAERL